MARQSNRPDHGDAAVGSSVIAFLVAGVLFMASVVAVLVTTQAGSDAKATSDAPDSAAIRIQAESLAGILLSSPGYAGLAGGDWAVDAQAGTGKSANADDLARLGLLDAAAPGFLSFSKFQNLRHAPLAAADDGWVNYEEAVRSLGLDASAIDFHVRAYPSLGSVRDMQNCGLGLEQCKDQNLRVTYVGDLEAPAVTVTPTGPSVASQVNLAPPTCSVSPTPKSYRISSSAVNGGTGPTQFRGVIEVAFSQGLLYTKTVNTPILAPGEPVSFDVDVPNYLPVKEKPKDPDPVMRRCGAGTVIKVDLYDSTDKLASQTATLGTAVANAATTGRDLILETNTYFLTGSPLELQYRGGNIGGAKLFFELRQGDATGPVVHSQAIQSSNNGKGGKITVPAQAEGPYTGVLYGEETPGALVVRVATRVLVTSTPPLAYAPSGATTTTTTPYQPTAVVETEVHFLDTLLHKFCPSYWDTKAASALTGWTEAKWDPRCGSFKDGYPLAGQVGDVFPDKKKQLEEGLVPRLICQVAAGCPDDVAKGEPRYDLFDVLVVGSSVDHNELAPAQIKYAIEDWVRGGGTIIVFGSGEQSVNWLMPILKTGIKGSSGAVSVPDAAHPILHVPDELDYSGYQNAGKVWDFRGSHNANELFTQVVAQGGVTDFEPILAISNPGAIRDDETGTAGTVILTSWQPHDLYLSGTEARLLEGMKFVNNLLMLGYGDLYLDYGPEIPTETNVIPAIRFAQIQHPDFDEPVQLKMNVFVFPRVL